MSAQTAFAGQPVSWRQEWRPLLRLMLPILLTQVAQAGYGLIDTLMAGRLSPADLASVAIGAGLWLPVVLFLSGILMATTPLVSEALGAKRPQDIPPVTAQALLLAVLLGLAGSAILSGLPWLFPWIGIPESLAPKAALFLRCIAWGMPAVTLYATLRGYTEALGHPRPVTLISLAGLILVVPLNAVFLYGWGPFPAMGGAGCGVANAITQWILLGVLATYLSQSSDYHSVRITWSGRRWDAPAQRRFLAIGLPIGLAILFEASLFCVAALVLSPLGDVVVAAHQIALSVTSQLFMLPLSLAIAVTIRIGTAYGAQAWEQIRAIQRAGFTLATLVSVITMTLLLLCRNWIPQAYTPDHAVQQLAGQLLLFAAMYQVADAWQVTAAGCLRGLQETRWPMWITLICYWVVALPLGIYLAHHTGWGAQGLWLSLLTGLFMASAGLLWRLRLHTQRLGLSSMPH